MDSGADRSDHREAGQLVIRAALIVLAAVALGFGVAFVIATYTDGATEWLLSMVAGGVIYKAALAVYRATERGHGGLVASGKRRRLPPGS